MGAEQSLRMEAEVDERGRATRNTEYPVSLSSWAPKAKSSIQKYGLAPYACRWASGRPIRIPWRSCDKGGIVMVFFTIDE